LNNPAIIYSSAVDSNDDPSHVEDDASFPATQDIDASRDAEAIDSNVMGAFSPDGFFVSRKPSDSTGPYWTDVETHGIVTRPSLV
jgi:hypothetical protein